MASVLWLIGALPPDEQQPFVRGLMKVLSNWLMGDMQPESRWPPKPFGKAAPPDAKATSRGGKQRQPLRRNGRRE